MGRQVRALIDTPQYGRLPTGKPAECVDNNSLQQQLAHNAIAPLSPIDREKEGRKSESSTKQLATAGAIATALEAPLSGQMFHSRSLALSLSLSGPPLELEHRK